MKKAILLFTIGLLMAGNLFAQEGMAVLMCVASADALVEGEIIIKTRFEELGMFVNAVTASDAQGNDAYNYDMVFVHEAIGSASAGDKFKEVAIPFITTEFYLSDDMAFSGTISDQDFGSIGSDPGNDILLVEDVEHPITQGFTGEIVVYDSLGNMGFAVVQGDGVSLLSYPENPDRSMLFTYEEGSSDMNGDEVPARRVFFFTFNNNEKYMNDVAWTLFDRSVKWVLDIEIEEPEDTTDTYVDYPTMNKPETFHLAQNHPNPFNPITTIHYYLTSTSRIKLDVFTLRGEKVAMLVDEVQAAGSHTVSFDASELSSGIYLYRLQSENKILTKKMALMR